MAKVKAKQLFWDPSPSDDVAGHRVYYAQGVDALIDVNCLFEDVGPELSANISVVLDGQDEGIFSFGVATLDDAGNEADIYQHESWVNVPLDLMPPAPVSGGGIRDF